MDIVIVVAVLAVLVALVAVALVLVLRGRRADRERKHRLAGADRLRDEAAGHLPGVQAAEQHAHHADVDAEEARVRADQADHVAAEAHRDLAREQAAQENVVRRADSADPRVDTDADDYAPITGPDMKGTPPAQ